jgi:hypothetical protein
MKKIIEQEWLSRGIDSRLINVGWQGSKGYQNWDVPDVDYLTETETKRLKQRYDRAAERKNTNLSN